MRVDKCLYDKRLNATTAMLEQALENLEKKFLAVGRAPSHTTFSGPCDPPTMTMAVTRSHENLVGTKLGFLAFRNRCLRYI